MMRAENSTSESTSRKRMWPSLETAVSLYNWSNGFLLFALVVGLIATFFVVWMGNVKEEYSNSDLAKSRERTALLEKQSGESQLAIAEAKKRSDEAKAEAAKANERAAELGKEAEVAKFEQEKLKEQLAWRVVSPDVASRLENALARTPGSVNLNYVAGDPDAFLLANQISGILSKAGWKVAGGPFVPSSQLIFGVFIPDATGDDANALRKSFSEARVAFSTKPIEMTGSGSGSEIAGAPMIFIGFKLPGSSLYKNR